jgi:hypothetical protein
MNPIKICSSSDDDDQPLCKLAAKAGGLVQAFPELKPEEALMHVHLVEAEKAEKAEAAAKKKAKTEAEKALKPIFDVTNTGGRIHQRKKAGVRTVSEENHSTGGGDGLINLFWTEALCKLNLELQSVPKDGHCQFSALAIMLWRDASRKAAIRLRQELAAHLQSNPDINWAGRSDNAHITDILVGGEMEGSVSPRHWGDRDTLMLAALLFDLRILVLMRHSRTMANELINPHGNLLVALLFDGQEDHYYATRPLSSAAAASPAVTAKPAEERRELRSTQQDSQSFGQLAREQFRKSLADHVTDKGNQTTFVHGVPGWVRGVVSSVYPEDMQAAMDVVHEVMPLWIWKLIAPDHQGHLVEYYVDQLFRVLLQNGVRCRCSSCGNQAVMLPWNECWDCTAGLGSGANKANGHALERGKTGVPALGAVFGEGVPIPTTPPEVSSWPLEMHDPTELPLVVESLEEMLALMYMLGLDIEAKSDDDWDFRWTDMILFQIGPDGRRFAVVALEIALMMLTKRIVFVLNPKADDKHGFQGALDQMSKEGVLERTEAQRAIIYSKGCAKAPVDSLPQKKDAPLIQIFVYIKKKYMDVRGLKPHSDLSDRLWKEVHKSRSDDLYAGNTLIQYVLAEETKTLPLASWGAHFAMGKTSGYFDPLARNVDGVDPDFIYLSAPLPLDDSDEEDEDSDEEDEDSDKEDEDSDKEDEDSDEEDEEVQDEEDDDAKADQLRDVKRLKQLLNTSSPQSNSKVSIVHADGSTVNLYPTERVLTIPQIPNPEDFESARRWSHAVTFGLVDPDGSIVTNGLVDLHTQAVRVSKARSGRKSVLYEELAAWIGVLVSNLQAMLQVYVMIEAASNPVGHILGRNEGMYIHVLGVRNDIERQLASAATRLKKFDDDTKDRQAQLPTSELPEGLDGVNIEDLAVWFEQVRHYSEQFRIPLDGSINHVERDIRLSMMWFMQVFDLSIFDFDQRFD